MEVDSLILVIGDLRLVLLILELKLKLDLELEWRKTKYIYNTKVIIL